MNVSGLPLLVYGMHCNPKACEALGLLPAPFPLYQSESSQEMETSKGGFKIKNH